MPIFSLSKTYPTLEQKTAWIRLCFSKNIGPKTFFKLLDKFSSSQEIIEFLQSQTNKKFSLAPKEIALKELEKADKKNIKIITLLNPDYPLDLAQIPSPPPILYVKGNQNILDEKSISIVGARNASLNGKKIARKLGFDLSQEGFNIVSGMAKGIDTASHEGALSDKTKASTVAVLGTGVDVVYPKENQKLYEKIIEKGAVVSEFPIGSTPLAQNFPRRNRIISGMSLGTIVVEASARSGSLISARYAIEQNKEVFAVPGSPLDARCEGPNKLIKQGAMLIESTKDVIDNLGSDFMKNYDKKQPSLNFEEKISIEEKEQKSPTSSGLEQLVIENIGNSPTYVDDIIRECGLTYSKVSSILLELELKGKLERHSANRVSLI